MKGVKKLLPTRKRKEKKVKVKVKVKREKREFGKILGAFSNISLWKNLKLGQKYGVALFITIGLFTVSTLITFTLLTMANSKMETVRQSGEKAVLITEVSAMFHQKGSMIGTYIIDEKPRYLNQFEDISKNFDGLKKEIQPILTTPETKELFRQIDENDKKVTDVFKNTIIPEMQNDHEYKFRLGKLQVDNIVYETVLRIDELRKKLKDEQNAAIHAAKTSIYTTLVVLVVSIIVSALLGIASILLIGRIISRKLSQIVSLSNEIAAGNLNVDSVEYSGKDEIAELSVATNAMKDRLQAMIQEISAVSIDVTDRSGELNTAANEVKAASQQVASTMQELSSGAEDQADSATSLAHLMEDYLHKVETATESGTKIQEVSTEVLTLTKQGDTLMNASQHQMVKINEIMLGSVQKVKGLDDRTKQISSLVQVIQDIAAQTNLLALNAAIEAARAGEHGRGFAVVADEVRKLAEQVTHSVADITNIVKGIQTESKEVVSSLELGYGQVEQGTEQIRDTGLTFNKIYEAINLMTRNVTDISTNLEKVANDSVKMNQSIENIASVSEESAAGIEQASASVLQTNQSMEDISNNAASLSELADQLNSMISKFKL
ncbi:HAMP domain-containing methyl-accepting chemotaxis protein [Bacillus sp. 31A1R]|uniref:HAMP domain-containing methyl-accepting chemotaxis protein n=1 Tax=Robertmurraya mangrovi TaxID=3098077 RepID=A0ABU5ITP5_9BACI|nr:HAMP domain-containing methyl-accepting chemotaxis protein [Bacillus sp. 31A1R]MDZ5470528.1 HAMP domain-containing methyl-accepting chemotaxis protein [Bacillus sp. 31A1R]